MRAVSRLALRRGFAFGRPGRLAVLAGNFVYVPGFGGSIFKLAKSDGRLRVRLSSSRWL